MTGAAAPYNHRAMGLRGSLLPAVTALSLWGADPVPVHGRSELPSSEALSAESQAFRRFVEVYRGEIARRGPAVQPGWEFWAVLRENPRKPMARHVVVVGRKGPLTVRVAEFAAGELGAAGLCQRIADISLRAANAPPPRAAVMRH